MGKKMIHKKVRFKGEIYWLSHTDFGFNLSPLDHYDESGELLANPFRDISYAFVFNGKIMRFEKEIGTMADLEEVK